MARGRPQVGLATGTAPLRFTPPAGVARLLRMQRLSAAVNLQGSISRAGRLAVSRMPPACSADSLRGRPTRFWDPRELE
jgi:hypothetical protein